MVASRFLNCLLFIIVNVSTGAVLPKPQPKDDSDDIDESSNQLDPGEPPYNFQKRKGNINELIGTHTAGKQRYRCYSCESADCSNHTVCEDAIQCWKSRVRESSGEERVTRGCTTDAAQLPLICQTPVFAVQHKRHALGQFHIKCCVGDFCNGGEFPELPPLYQEEIPSDSQNRTVSILL